MVNFAAAKTLQHRTKVLALVAMLVGLMGHLQGEFTFAAPSATLDKKTTKVAKKKAVAEPEGNSEGAPKRPATSYMLWVAENRDAIKKSLGPDAKVTAVAKEAGERWKALSASGKSKWEKEAAKLKEKYDAEKKEFLASGGVMPKNTKKEEKTKKVKDPNAPKRPLSAYMLWLKDNRESIKKSLPDGFKVTDITKEAGRLWAELDEAKKSPYTKQYEEAKEEYKELMHREAKVAAE